MVTLRKTLNTKLSRIVGVGAALSIVFVALFPSLQSNSHLRGVAVVLFRLAGNLLLGLGLYCLWMLFTATIAKNVGRNMTIFGAGTQLATVATMLMTRASLLSMNVLSFSYFVALGYLLAFALIVTSICTLRCYGLAEEAFLPMGQIGKRLSFRSMGLVLRIPYLRWLVIVIIANAAFSGALRWQIYKFSESEQSANRVAKILTTFYLYTAYAALASQLVLVPIVFHVLTPRYGLLLVPVVGFVALLMRYHSGSANTLLISIALFSSLDYTVNNCMREAMYIPLPLSVKVHLKATMALLIPKLGDILGSGVILLFGRSGTKTWVLSMAVLGTAWIAAAALVLRLYGSLPLQEEPETASSVDNIE